MKQVAEVKHKLNAYIVNPTYVSACTVYLANVEIKSVHSIGVHLNCLFQCFLFNPYLYQFFFPTFVHIILIGCKITNFSACLFFQITLVFMTGELVHISSKESVGPSYTVITLSEHTL